MIDKQAIKEVIIDYQRIIPRFNIVERNLFIESIPNYVFVGLRRAGKSYMMYADIQRRIDKGDATINDILFINFEDERLIGMDVSDLSSIIECYREMFDNPAPLIYLDEIQNVEGWEKYVRRLADTGYHVWVTGSNARMLSQEIATTLGGRFLIKYVPTFSFKEYLKFESLSPSDNWQYDSEERLQLRKRLDEYFHFGGFAETFKLIDKRNWINSLYQKILLSDIISRNGYRNERAIAFLVRKLAESVKQPCSQTRLQNLLKSTGTSISRNTIADYLESLNQSFLTFELKNFRHSLSERTLESKRYFSDNGLLNNFLLDPNTSLLENIVAIELMNKYFYEKGEEIFYYRNGIELDFYIPSTNTAIQVSYSLSEPETMERELNAIQKASKHIEIKDAWIVTYDDKPSFIKSDNCDIRVIPLLDFLLQ